jgi:hypothetical protein
MDVAPLPDSYEYFDWKAKRDNLVSVLEEYGLQYFRGGRVLPSGQAPIEVTFRNTTSAETPSANRPSTLDELLHVMVRGLPRAMHPLTHRRKGAQPLSFNSEYDIQDLLHALLRPWIADIRPEEYTPSYAGTSTRMDFLLPAHNVVVELKRIRDRTHGKEIGNELILDIDHYRRHPNCDVLWCVIYDPEHFIPNPKGLSDDLSGDRTSPDGTIRVKVVVVSG